MQGIALAELRGRWPRLLVGISLLTVLMGVLLAAGVGYSWVRANRVAQQAEDRLLMRREPPRAVIDVVVDTLSPLDERQAAMARAQEAIAADSRRLSDAAGGSRSPGMAEASARADAAYRRLLAEAAAWDARVSRPEPVIAAQRDLARSFDQLLMALQAEEQARQRTLLRWLIVAGAVALSGAALGMIVGLRPRRLRVQITGDMTLTDFLNEMPDVLLELDAAGRIVFASDGVTELLGMPSDQLIGRNIYDLIPESDRAVQRAMAREQIIDCRELSGRVELPLVHADGTIRRTSAAGAFERDAEGRFLSMRVLVRDETKRIEAGDALRASEEQLRAVLETARSGILLAGRDGSTRIFNRALCDLLGYEWDEMASATIADLFPEETLASIAAPVWGSHASIRREESLRHRNGSAVDVDLSASPYIERGTVTGVLIEVRDATRRKMAEATVERLSLYDRLTGLPNRTLFDRRLTEAMVTADEQGELVGLVLFDLSAFKIVNDTLGHQAGDVLLREVGQRVDRVITAPHTLARLGADEFMVVVPAMRTRDEAVTVAAEIVTAFGEPFTYGGQELQIGAAIGVSIYPHDGDDGETLLRRADAALHAAKATERNTYSFYHDSMDTQADRLVLETEIRRALMRNEFEVYYQPIMRVDDGSVGLVEALVRWHHPERGLVGPDDFISVMEATDTIGALGAFVLREACAQTERWHRAGFPHLRVAVNISVRQMLDGTLPGLVASALQATELPARFLQLEITESVAVQHVDTVVHMLDDLRRLGVDAVLDDFGTGHSSLTHLKRFPVVGVKVDRSFVADMGRSPDDRAIVAGVIALGHALGLEVVAEGVETEQQAADLRAMQCDHLQGFLFSRGITAGALEAFLTVERHAVA